ncbi:MAG: hypothetical protein GXY42_04205 [Desulfovibrionales bacterium]|nr:hypothetical protein [Desulfovibrionales bacterium]
MTKQMSFKAQQREVEARYRTQIDSAESTEDVRKFFERTAVNFLHRAVGEQVDVQPDDVSFEPDAEPGYALSDRLLKNEAFSALWEESDLPQILTLLSERALNRYKYLARKHPDKTEMKIFQVSGPRRY